ncbi:probable serine/threonine-protein kinase clkA [Chrysoperla carnea]|uniref:probable serine/threonine-protein kinase clkA n=1 Tax=Chrysoperla carnea TaxID=189513 RepID=UPI001D06B922|nr:probable serine/threonine-protein kinase clkA [Chrysoperla carnea]
MLILTPSQQTDDQHTTPTSLLKHNNNNNNDRTLPPPPRVISAEIKKPNGCIITPPVKQQHVQRVQGTKNGCLANKNNCKKNISSSLDFIQPKISGELFVQYEDDINKKPIWLRSHVNIYGGILFITNFIINKQRIPLRDFNLRPVTSTSQDDSTTTSNRYIFALFSRHNDQRPEVTFKTRTEHEYNIWIKIISIELLKQTSIYNIKYLDLMGLTFNINNHTVATTNNNCINNNNEQEQRTRRRSSSSSSDHSTTSSHTDCSSRCSSLSSHHSSSNNSLTSRITSNYSCSRCNSLNRYNSNSSYSINDKKCSSCRNNSNSNITKVSNTRITPTTVSRYNSNSNNSTKPTANEKRRCFSELNLNLFEENNTKDNFNFNNNRILASTLSSSSSSSSEEEDNLDNTKTSSCIDCSNNYLSYSDYKKLLAKERIQRVLQPKIEKTQETNNNNNNTVIVPIRSYTRVYNIREGVQLKSYDLQLKSPPEPIKSHVKNSGESKKIDMLRKNTNQLINNNITSQSNVIEETVEQLLKKCQNSDNYVPVKDKLVLFESLCKLGRKSLINNQNLIIGANNNYNNTLSIEKRRTQSMYDLNNNHINGAGGVRQICKYFETQSTTNNTNKFNTIAKGYRKVISVDTPPLTPSVDSKHSLNNNDNGLSQYSGSRKTKMNNLRKSSQFIKSNTSYSLYNQSFDDFNKNTKNYFGFKQFREGNKIISYV